MFTVWTLRRISGLISKISLLGPVPASLKVEELTLAQHFGLTTTWSQFHLDCMLMSMRRNRPISLEVLPEIIDGLRAAVNAYGFARQGLGLRNPQQDLPMTASTSWDEEDQELLDSSMEEMSAEALDA